MKIKSISTCREYIALKTPFITALRRVDVIEFVRLHVEYDDGSESFGEAPATFAITGEDLETIENSIDSIKSKLLHVEVLQALEIVHNSSIGSSAKAALDMALYLHVHSLHPKSASSLSLTAHVENTKGTLTTDITISLNAAHQMFEDAKDAVNNGMNILKVKLGSDIQHAIEVTKLLAQLDARLIIDANQAWSLEDSLYYIDEVKDIGLELIEQPVIASDIKSLKIITNYSTIPILADEAVFTLEDAKKVIESKSADMINIKLMKCGGVSKAIEILEYAREQGVKCMFGSMLEGPISINAALHVAMKYSDIILHVDLDSPLLYKEPSELLEFKFDGCEVSLIST